MSSRKNKPITDPDNPEWTATDFAKAKDPKDVLSPEVLAQFGRHRGRQRAPRKVPVSIRLSPVVVKHFKAKGPGWQSKIDEILVKIAKKATATKAATSTRRKAGWRRGRDSELRCKNPLKCSFSE
jgi:uncharacterized protein (DUF4415 family)